MKYLLLLILAGLAAAEYFHHLSSAHHLDSAAANAQTASEAKADYARDMFRQHLHRH